jgi:uncharacterized repeat protein (TIGR04138 family)
MRRCGTSIHLINGWHIFRSENVVAVLWLGGLILFLVRASRDGKRGQRLAAGQCVECGYDLRASEGNCPECNAPIPKRRRDGVDREQYRIATDIPCFICGANLRGAYLGGRCPDCGRNIPISILGVIAAALGVDLEQIKFIQIAIEREFRRRRQNENTVANHITATEACIAVRDYALKLCPRPARAKRMLFRLGITGGEQIGKVIWAMVDRGMYEAADEDNPEQFHGLFTLDELMTAPAIKRDEAIG